MNLQLDPEEIKVLANKINETVKTLDNVQIIIQNTRTDLDLVENLKNQANASK